MGFTPFIRVFKIADDYRERMLTSSHPYSHTF